MILALFNELFKCQFIRNLHDARTRNTRPSRIFAILGGIREQIHAKLHRVKLRCKVEFFVGAYRKGKNVPWVIENSNIFSFDVRDRSLTRAHYNIRVIGCTKWYLIRVGCTLREKKNVFVLPRIATFKNKDSIEAKAHIYFDFRSNFCKLIDFSLLPPNQLVNFPQKNL